MTKPVYIYKMNENTRESYLFFMDSEDFMNVVRVFFDTHVLVLRAKGWTLDQAYRWALL